MLRRNRGWRQSCSCRNVPAHSPVRTTPSAIARSSARRGAAFFLAAFIGLAISSVLLSAAETDAKAPTDVFALLEAHCVKCHGGEKTKGGLDLMTREALLRGGESGAAVVPGKPDASLLIRQVRHEEEPHMPHKEAKLPDAAIAQLVEWVKSGVPYPRALAKTPQPNAEKAVAKFAEIGRAHV